MNADSVFELLTEANPVPDSSRYDQRIIDKQTFLANTKERNLRMETITATPEQQKPPTPRLGLATAVAVFAIVIIGVAALTLTSGPEVITPSETTVTTVPAPTTTVTAIAPVAAPPFSTATDAAQAYLTAKYVGTYDQLEPLMADNARNISYFAWPGDAEHVELRFAWQQSTLGPYRDLICTDTRSNTVTCTYITEFLDLTKGGADGTVKFTQSFSIDDAGFLFSVGSEHATLTDQLRTAAGAFNTWMTERYPDLVTEEDALFDGGAVTRTFEEMRADWDAAIAEYASENS